MLTMTKNRLWTLQVLLLEASVLLNAVECFHQPPPMHSGTSNNLCHHQFRKTRTQGRRHYLKAEDHDRSVAAANTSVAGAATRASTKFRNFDEVLSTYHGEPLMVIFTAVNCGPCRLMKKEMNHLSSLMGDKRFKMVAVDTEKFPHVGSRFEVAALPCLLLVHNGEPILRLEGVVKAEEVFERVRTITPL
jgi:thioredoxin-like negative regulator of GroEL